MESSCSENISLTVHQNDKDLVRGGKVSILALLLLLVMVGNSVLFHHTRTKCRIPKWKPSIYILNIIAVCGFLNGSVNITVFLGTTLTGMLLNVASN